MVEKQLAHYDVAQLFSNPAQGVRGLIYQDYEIQPHTHDFYELNIVMGGSGLHRIANNCVPVKRGATFVIPPMTVHSYENTANLAVYHLLLTPEFVRTYVNAEEDYGIRMLLKIEPLLRGNASKNLFLQLSADQLSMVKNDLDCILDNVSESYPDTATFKKHTALKLLNWLAYLFVRQCDEKGRKIPNETEYAIMRTLDYIYENYASHITVDTLCRESNMSRATLFRNFKAYCGCSPMAFLRSHRKAVAVSLLAQKGRSKTEIANECGFYDLSHMEKVLNAPAAID